MLVIQKVLSLTEKKSYDRTILLTTTSYKTRTNLIEISILISV